MAESKQARVVDAAQLLEKLRREQFAAGPSTPGGLVLQGEDRGRDVGYRQGWNDCAQAIGRWIGGGQ